MKTPQNQNYFPRHEDAGDLGFGGRVVEKTRTRFLNRDGSFNVSRRGLPLLGSVNIYHVLLMTPWRRFFGIIIGSYFLLNVCFALAYFCAGPQALRGSIAATDPDRLVEAFFFSVQTLSAIGYGGLLPASLVANFLVTMEALAGLLFFAVATGLIFARFSRPVGKIIFSRNAVLAPYRGKTAFQFRVMNTMSNQMIDVRARVVLVRTTEKEGWPSRSFEELPLERPSVTVFPLQWTVVHPIDDKSPLWNMPKEQFEAQDMEFIILLSGFDETFSQIVHTRSSYKFHEIIPEARFADMFVDSDDGRITVDLRQFHEIQRIVPQEAG
jgi:inward rectifier potassium channel